MQKLFIFILIFLNFLYSSDNFSIIINRPFNNALFDVTQDYDRDITAVGFSREYKETSSSNNTYTNAFDYLSSLSNSYGSQMHLLKIDKSGNILINKTAKMNRFSEAIAVTKTPSNGYIIGGYTLDGSLIIAKLDANARVIFSKMFGTKNYDRMNNLVMLSDGGVLAVGSSITTRSPQDNLFETGLGLNDIYITRFSKDGKKLWSKKYGTLYDDRGIDAVEAFDGSILVLGTTSHNNNQDVTLMRITENGNKIWLKHYKSETLIKPYKIIRLRDNNFLVSLGEQDTLGKEQVRLIKFDLQKNILIDQKISTTYASAIRDIKEFSDGSLIGVGYVKDTFNTDALVMIFDSSLNMIHQEHYGKENYDILNSLTILHNSQVAAAGIFTPENSQESKMWILKLNRDGTIAKKTKNYTIEKNKDTLYNELVKIFKKDIQMHKITIYKDLSIHLTDKNLYFKAAQYKLTKIQKNYLKKFFKKLYPFLKRHKNIINGLEINGHTSSEWKNTNFTQRYLKNEKLSMQRSYSVISYIFKNQDKKTQVFLSKLIKGSGLSFSKRVYDKDKENKKNSRRVSFKILHRIK